MCGQRQSSYTPNCMAYKLFHWFFSDSFCSRQKSLCEQLTASKGRSRLCDWRSFQSTRQRQQCVQPRVQLLALKQTKMGGLSVEEPALSFHCWQRETENRIGCLGREALVQWRGGGQPEGQNCGFARAASACINVPQWHPEVRRLVSRFVLSLVTTTDQWIKVQTKISESIWNLTLQ